MLVKTNFEIENMDYYGNDSKTGLYFIVCFSINQIKYRIYLSYKKLNKDFTKNKQMNLCNCAENN